MGKKIALALFLTSGAFLLAAEPVPTDDELEAAIKDEISTKEAKAAGEHAAQVKKLTATPQTPVKKNVVPEASFTPLPGTEPLSLSDTFNLEKSPGRGTLTLKKMDQNEVIDLGPPGAQYGYGLVFRHQTLPEELMHQYGTTDVILFSFGTLLEKLEGRVPEFATLMLFTKSKPNSWKGYPIGLAGESKDKNREFGLVLATSSRALSQRTDEERLKDTYFSKSGSIRLSSSGTARGLDIPIQEKNLSFKVQPMKLAVEAELSTPFNAEKRQLHINVEIPVYWPESPAALTWMKKIALTSLSQSNQLKAPGSPRAISSKSP